ncbi:MULTISPECIES: hypothetical protein [unclassified Gordonia (in: high G+C Gram-positive bacteria)]|uniref:hypothetical protein n=1 Tax=Gordonia TaxID=2053 RepID=UPI00081548E0|nr:MULTISPECIES: hypothetical protein [unclassified Gordonia (in: high G+C Gram-positive bacteria)]MCX2752471.1 hypothetical protein [Gordonia sp. 4N]SCB87863.1 hypothetical protein GA0061091_102291 [Gordonia sp. v-85]
MIEPHAPRLRLSLSGRLVPGAVAGLVAAALVLSACSVGGQPEPSSPDLSARSVEAADFPDGAASPIPTSAVANALADVTGAPMPGQTGTEVSPPECAPASVSADGAVAFLGPGPGERATLTSVVAGVETPLGDVVESAERCPETTTTTFGASSTITTEVLPPPPAPDGVDTATIRRTIVTGGGVPSTTSALTLLGERDGVRVYTEYRWPAAGPVPPEASAALDTLFGKALAAAFG